MFMADIRKGNFQPAITIFLKILSRLQFFRRLADGNHQIFSFIFKAKRFKRFKSTASVCGRRPRALFRKPSAFLANETGRRCYRARRAGGVNLVVTPRHSHEYQTAQNSGSRGQGHGPKGRSVSRISCTNREVSNEHPPSKKAVLFLLFLLVSETSHSHARVPGPRAARRPRVAQPPSSRETWRRSASRFGRAPRPIGFPLLERARQRVRRGIE